MDKIKDFFTELAEHPLLEQLVQLLTDNIWTVLAFAIATALTVIGLVYARKQEKRAQKQDAAVPELLVDLYGCADPEVKDFYFLLPFKEKRAIFVPLMINIGNKGPISADTSSSISSSVSISTGRIG